MSNKTANPTHLAKPIRPKLSASQPNHLAVDGESLPSQLDSSRLSDESFLPKFDPPDPTVISQPSTQFTISISDELDPHNLTLSFFLFPCSLSIYRSLSLPRSLYNQHLQFIIFQFVNLHHCRSTILLHCQTAVISLRFDFQSFSLFTSSFQSPAHGLLVFGFVDLWAIYLFSLFIYSFQSLQICYHLSLFLFVFFRFVGYWCLGLFICSSGQICSFRFVKFVTSLVFDLCLSIKVGYNHHPPEPDPTRSVVFRDWRRVLRPATRHDQISFKLNLNSNRPNLWTPLPTTKPPASSSSFSHFFFASSGLHY